MPTSSVLLLCLMRLTGKPLLGRAAPSENISVPWVRLLGAQPVRRYRSLSPGRIPPHNGTGAHKGHAFFAYADNYLIDLKAAIIVDVEAPRAIRQAEVGAAHTMIERTEDRLGLCPERLAADSAYGSAEMLGWLVNEHAIEPHIRMGRSPAKTSPTIRKHDLYVCPAGKVLGSTGTLANDGATLLYRASKYDCDACELKPRCCPKMPARKVPRSTHEQARDVARDIAKTDAYVRSRRERKKIEMLFAHLKRILRLDRLRLSLWCSGRVPPCDHCPEPPKFGKADPAARPRPA